jgi:peroxin-10
MNNKLASCEVIMRSIQKDNEFIDTLALKIFEFMEHISDFIRIGINSNTIEIFSKFLFYFSAYKFNKQTNTVGEEYTRVRKNKTMLIYIIIQSIKSYIFKKIVEKFNLAEMVCEKLEDLQYALFFINGRYYDIIQLVFNVINYETVETRTIIDQNSFKLLGYIIFIKLTFETIFWLRKKYKERKAKTSDDVKKNLKLRNIKHITDEDSEYSCLLCLDVRKDTSLTPCGHLFCWECIISYLLEKPSCPFCRKECFPQNIIYLHNYK